MMTRKMKNKLFLVLLSFLMIGPLFARRPIPLKQKEWDTRTKSLSITGVDAYIEDDDRSLILSFSRQLGNVIVTVTNQVTGEVFCTNSFFAPENYTKEIYFSNTLESGGYVLTIRYGDEILTGCFFIY